MLVRIRTGRRIHRKGQFDLIRKPRRRRELHSSFCLSRPPTAADGLGCTPAFDLAFWSSRQAAGFGADGARPTSTPFGLLLLGNWKMWSGQPTNSVFGPGHSGPSFTHAHSLRYPMCFSNGKGQQEHCHQTLGARHQDHHPSCTPRSTTANARPTLACHCCREFTRLSLHPVVASTKGIITAMNCQTTSWCTLVDSPASRVSKTIQLWKNQIARAALA